MIIICNLVYIHYICFEKPNLSNMKNLKFKFTAITLAVATLFSCNNEEQSYDVQQVKVTKEGNLIERNVQNLSSVDAAKLAKQFSINENEGGSRTAFDVAIKDIQTITSETGEPLMYVVNYANNKGFTVISATKNYAPVLAYSDEGYLNVNDASFTDNIFIDEYKTYIESVVGLECDSLRRKYAIDWSFYEKKSEAVNSRAYTDEQIQQELANARTYYSNQGYEILPLGSAPYLMSAVGGQTGEDRGNAFIGDICAHTPPQYDCMDVTLLLVKRTNNQVGPYLQTAWHQDDPYAINTPNQTAGCMKIAVAQMMYYYRHPSTYEWDNIRVDWGKYLFELTDDEIYFMNEIGKSLNQNHIIQDTTMISIPNMKKTFEDNFYFTEELDYNRNTAKEYIKLGIPLIMYGKNENDEDYAHVWICDGYKSPKVQYAAYMIDRNFEVYKFYSGMTDDLGEYFHMNMGTGNNMWYYQDDATYEGDNYSVDRIMYYIVPNTTN